MTTAPTISTSVRGKQHSTVYESTHEAHSHHLNVTARTWCGMTNHSDVAVHAATNVATLAPHQVEATAWHSPEHPNSVSVGLRLEHCTLTLFLPVELVTLWVEQLQRLLPLALDPEQPTHHSAPLAPAPQQ